MLFNASIHPSYFHMTVVCVAAAVVAVGDIENDDLLWCISVTSQIYLEVNLLFFTSELSRPVSPTSPARRTCHYSST